MSKVYAMTGMLRADGFRRFFVGFLIGVALMALVNPLRAHAETVLRAPEPNIDAVPTRTLETAIFAGATKTVWKNS